MSMRFRAATSADLAAIVHMLADDDLGRQRERDEVPLPNSYQQAFEVITSNPNHELIVAELDDQIMGTLHLIFLHSLSYQGGLRAQVEAVRVDKKFQNQKIGSQMMEHAIQRAKARGAHLMQLTTHQTRTDAHRFYERLGFKASHLGMKLNLK
jgi:GNAT superfamily N-acetyltransferase